MYFYTTHYSNHHHHIKKSRNGHDSNNNSTHSITTSVTLDSSIIDLKQNKMDNIVSDVDYDLELPYNWYLKWPYNERQHRNDSVRTVQTFYILERWQRDMSMFVGRDLGRIIQDYVCKEQVESNNNHHRLVI